jgi:hypothetical protein
VYNFDGLNNPVFKILIFTVIAVLFILILWSVATETLVPLYNSKNYGELIYNMFGIPVLLFGVAIFAYGAWFFTIDTAKLLNNNLQIAENVDIIRKKSLPKDKIKAARKENLNLLFSTQKKGAVRLLIGALFIIAGILILNLKRILG